MFTINFKEDWRAYVEFELKSLDFSYDNNVDSSSNYLRLLKIQRRIPCLLSRKVYYAKTFSVPDCHKNDLAILVKKISQGDNLRPYLSRKIDKERSSDGALDDFGTHHLHFCPEGTKKVAFAWINQEAVYFIAVCEHERDSWFNTHFVQIIHDNWPELITHCRVPIKSNKLTPDERKNLRCNGYNTPIIISDGTVYQSPGGGFVSGGHTMSDYWKNMLVIRHLESYEVLVRQEEAQFRGFLGLVDAECLTLRMGFNASNFWIFEPTKQVNFINGTLGYLWQPNISPIYTGESSLAL